MVKSSEVPLVKEFDLLTFCHYRLINVLQRQDPWWLFWSSFSHFALNYWRRWDSFLSSTHILKTSLKDNAKENSYLIFINFESKEEINYVNSFQLQMENNRWVSVTNKDSVDGKTWEVFESRSREHHMAKLTFLKANHPLYFLKFSHFIKKVTLKYWFIFWSWNRLWFFKCCGSC